MYKCIYFQDAGDVDDDASYKFPEASTRGQGDTDEDNGSKRWEFPTLKIWILGWLVMDVVAVVGLGVAIGLFADLGTWAMSHEPIHMALFVTIIVLEVLLIYTGVIIGALFIMLKDQWLMGILGPGLAGAS